MTRTEAEFYQHKTAVGETIFPLRFRQPDRGAIVISKEDFNASFRQKLSPLIAQ